MKRAGSRAAAIALLVLLVWISYQFILQPARLLQDEMRSRLQNAQALLQRQQLALNKLPTVRARLHRLQELAAGEQIDVEPGAFLYKQGSVKMDTVKLGIRTGMFAGTNIFLNRFTGPGKLGIQSMTFHLDTGE